MGSGTDLWTRHAARAVPGEVAAQIVRTPRFPIIRPGSQDRELSHDRLPLTRRPRDEMAEIAARRRDTDDEWDLAFPTKPFSVIAKVLEGSMQIAFKRPSAGDDSQQFEAIWRPSVAPEKSSERLDRASDLDRPLTSRVAQEVDEVRPVGIVAPHAASSVPVRIKSFAERGRSLCALAAIRRGQ